MLPQGFIQDLLSRIDVVEVVGRHVELKKAGINHKGLCPFHGEKSPSFIVSPSRQTYHCFGCGAHGDAIRFLTEHSGLAFMDAVRDLAQQAGLAIPEQRASADELALAAQAREQRASLGEVLERAAQHYRQALKSTPRAIDYLKARGLTGEVAARFGLGFAADGWRTLAGVFPRYDDPLLSESGLVIVQGEGEDTAEQKRYDRFRDRIMFPIRSVRGDVIGFGGRVLDRGEPKYLNSPETPLFHKGQELYGLFEARQAIRERACVLVVEGYMDVVALAQSGFGNAVATLGTACTAEHLAKLFRFTDSVVFSFDGDGAGRRAAGRALEASLEHATDTRTIRFLFLPAEHDPDSYVRDLGPEAFEQALALAVPLSVQLVSQAGQGCDLATAEGRARMLSQARSMVDQLPTGLLREQVEGDLAQRAGMALESLKAHWGRRDRPATSFSASSRRLQAMGQRRAPPQTATLLDRSCWLLARQATLWHQLTAEEHDLLTTQPAPYGLFFAALERVLHDQGLLPMASLLDDLARDAQADALAPLLARLREFHAMPDDDPSHAMTAVLHRLRQRAIDDELQWLIESGELSEAATQRRNQLFSLRSQLKALPPMTAAEF